MNDANPAKEICKLTKFLTFDGIGPAVFAIGPSDCLEKCVVLVLSCGFVGTYDSSSRFLVRRPRERRRRQKDQKYGQEPPHIRNTPNAGRSGIGASKLTAKANPSTSRVCAGSITPSSHSRAVA